MKNVLRSHYLLWFGSLSGVLPFTSIFAREHVKASPSEIGLLYTLLPFVAFLTKPLVCGIADRFNGHKITLVVVMIATMIGFGSLVITPWLHAGPWSWWYFCACVMLANTAMGVGTTLTDSIVMREVTNGTTSYGSIRLWGTVGWGIFGNIFRRITFKHRLIQIFSHFPSPWYPQVSLPVASMTISSQDFLTSFLAWSCS